MTDSIDFIFLNFSESVFFPLVVSLVPFKKKLFHKWVNSQIIFHLAWFVMFIVANVCFHYRNTGYTAISICWLLPLRAICATVTTICAPKTKTCIAVIITNFSNKTCMLACLLKINPDFLIQNSSLKFLLFTFFFPTFHYRGGMRFLCCK